MKDMVPKGTGNSRFMKSSIPADITHEEMVALLRAGTFPYDLGSLNDDGIATKGTPLNKSTLLRDETAAAFFGGGLWTKLSTTFLRCLNLPHLSAMQT